MDILRPREFPEVFDWVSEFIPKLESIDATSWANRLSLAVQIRDEWQALYELEAILRLYQKEEKPKLKKFSAHLILIYLDWILVPKDLKGKLGKICRNLGNNLAVWIFVLLCNVAIDEGQWSEGLMLVILLCVSAVWIHECFSAFKNSPIYRNYLHMAGIAGAFLGVFIGLLNHDSIRGWLFLGLGGYAIGVSLGTVFTFLYPRFRRSL